MPKSHTLRTMYKNYDGPLPYKAFREACESFNRKSMDQIIQGKTLNMGHRLSTISIIKIKRNYDKKGGKAVNWKKSNKRKQELLDQGKDPDNHKWLVFYTTDWYCRFYWKKRNCIVPNKSVYSFHPTGGKKGNKKKLKEALEKDSLHHKNFELKNNRKNK